MLYQGNGFVIREFQKGDEASLALNANNFNVWKSVRDIFPHPYTYDDAVQWIDYNLGLDNPVNFTVEVDGDSVGAVGIIQGEDVYKKSIQIGYWLGEGYWGNGITTEAVKWLVDFCFSNFDINRVWASVFSNNEASKKVLKKCGFLHEATLKESIFKNNIYFDEHIYSVLKQ
jgi:ribosomal-protein-alanine N-acetyltransferase